MEASVLETSFTRPADTTAYGSGDLVANSTTAGSVVPLKFPIGKSNGLAFEIRRARIRKSGSTPTNGTFRLHLWNGVPGVVTNGDNGALAVANLKSYLGYFDFATVISIGTGCVQHAVPAIGVPLAVTACGDGNNLGGMIYGLLEARGAYTPESGEVIAVQLEALHKA